MRARLFIPISLLLLAGATAHAADVWNLLGSASVAVTQPDATPQRDEIRLPSARGAFTAIRLEVDGASVILDHVVVTFAHGSTQRVDLHKTLAPGGLTPVIELKGNDRVIRKVQFWYKTQKFATVRLYAH